MKEETFALIIRSDSRPPHLVIIPPSITAHLCAIWKLLLKFHFLWGRGCLAAAQNTGIGEQESDLMSFLIVSPRLDEFDQIPSKSSTWFTAESQLGSISETAPTEWKCLSALAVHQSGEARYLGRNLLGIMSVEKENMCHNLMANRSLKACQH